VPFALALVHTSLSHSYNPTLLTYFLALQSFCLNATMSQNLTSMAQALVMSWFQTKHQQHSHHVRCSRSCSHQSGTNCIHAQSWLSSIIHTLLEFVSQPSTPSHFRPIPQITCLFLGLWKGPGADFCQYFVLHTVSLPLYFPAIFLAQADSLYPPDCLHIEYLATIILNLAWQHNYLADNECT
jgi:hypothetical protein